MRVITISLAVFLLSLAPSCRKDKQPPPDKSARDASPGSSGVKPTRRRPAFEVTARTAGTHWGKAQRSAAINSGVAVIRKHQCTRCHKIDGIPGAGRPYDCASCHKFILSLRDDKVRFDKIAKKNGKATIERYLRNVAHLIEVPNLSGIGARVRPRWLARFVREPHDLRPVLEESMPRNLVSEAEAKQLARYFAAIADVPDPYGPVARTPRPVPPPPDAARLALGKDRYRKWGCPSCHVFGNVDFGIPAATLIAARAMTQLAPNLRFVRDRMRPSALLAWIKNPASVQKAAAMAQIPVEEKDAALIRDYLLYGDFGTLPPPDDPADRMKVPPPVKRKVGWAELKEEVLGDVCVHCHMNDHEKDTGPGNKGGLGYVGMGLSFRTYERTVWGAVDKDGTRYSVLVPRKGESLSRLVQVLLTRRVENRRDFLGPLADRKLPRFGKHVLGMPMGLPARSDEQIGIVRAWIAQGCPGPTKVTGKPGFTDGFLVPDGPIAKNRGCELRAPATPPPAWSSKPSKP